MGAGFRRRRPAGELDRARAEPEASPQRGAHVDERTVRMGTVAPGRGRWDGGAQARDGRLRGRELRGGHLLEVARAQHLPVRPGERRVELDLVLRLPGPRLAFGARKQGFAQPAAERARVALRRDMDGGEEEAGHAFEELRVAPEDVERLVEQRPLVGPAHEDRVQRPVEVVPPGHADRLDRAQCIEHRAASDRKTRGPQRAREVHEVGAEAPRNVGGDLWRRGIEGRHGSRFPRGRLQAAPAVRISRLNCSMMPAASLPRMRAMSSWYFSSEPKVSLTTSGDRARTSSWVSA